MTAPNERPAANWMDRLSDWIGSLVPGCGRLPARHPVKVTVVMGLLGLSSGWATMVLSLLATLVYEKNARIGEHEAFLVTGAALASLVAIPWSVWLGVRKRWLILFFPYCIAAGYGSFKLTEPFQGSRQEVGLFFLGASVGLAMSAVGLLIIRRPRIVWLIVTVLVSGGSQSLFVFIQDNPLLRSSLPMEVMIVFIVGWFFSLLHLPLAVCLGYLLWDRTAVPRQDAAIAAEKEVATEPRP